MSSEVARFWALAACDEYDLRPTAVWRVAALNIIFFCVEIREITNSLFFQKWCVCFRFRCRLAAPGVSKHLLSVVQSESRVNGRDRQHVDMTLELTKSEVFLLTISRGKIKWSKNKANSDCQPHLWVASALGRAGLGPWALGLGQRSLGSGRTPPRPAYNTPITTTSWSNPLCWTKALDS